MSKNSKKAWSTIRQLGNDPKTPPKPCKHDSSKSLQIKLVPANGDEGGRGHRGNPGPDGMKGERGKAGPPGVKGEPCSIQFDDIPRLAFEYSTGAFSQTLNGSAANVASVLAGGTTYVRWGRTTCPDSGAQEVYKGLAAGSWYAHKGGSSEITCLPLEPSWSNYADGWNSKAYIYGVEYDLAYDPFSHDNAEVIHNHDMPCVVCRVPTRGVELLFPAQNACPERWTLEYNGYLMAGYHDHEQRTQYMCVDQAPEVRAGSAGDVNGALLYIVEGNCGTLPCGPYVSGREFACAVCTI
ncbi:uncharacterized protein [Amphiura filiformis]|uniref:uncharacterized protein n=1 Tax=Amphiura filiformis TaxID=82378 RepID=UPI003B2146C5